MELLDLKQEAYYIYKMTHGNRDISYDKARRKLTRNILLTNDKRITKKGNLLCRYGCLDITIRNGQIIYVHNSYNRKVNFQKDINKYNYLNKLIGIEPDGKELKGLKKLFVDIRLKFVNI